MTAWILSDFNRALIIREIDASEPGARVTIDEEAQRTGPQNRLMWKLLNCFADQYLHCGRKYDAEEWKCILLKAFGKELEFVPALDDPARVVALGYRSSLLSKEEMSNFIEFILSEGLRRGVVFDSEAA